jgi:hypothetical protein
MLVDRGPPWWHDRWKAMVVLHYSTFSQNAVREPREERLTCDLLKTILRPDDRQGPSFLEESVATPGLISQTGDGCF